MGSKTLTVLNLANVCGLLIILAIVADAHIFVVAFVAVNLAFAAGVFAFRDEES